MAGTICLVTGATTGIGLVTARELAARGATVVIVGRSRERCEAAVETIKRQTGNEGVEFIVADLSSQADVRRAASEFLARTTASTSSSTTPAPCSPSAARALTASR